MLTTSSQAIAGFPTRHGSIGSLYVSDDAREPRRNDRRPLSHLWVDDDPLMRRAIKLAGSELAQHIDVVESAADAREVLRTGRASFDWIVCDYHLRDGTSTELVRELVAAGHRVVVLTGTEDPERIERSIGVRVFFKPIDLAAMLDELCGAGGRW